MPFEQAVASRGWPKNLISTSPEKNWMLFEFPSKYLTFLLVNLRTEFTCPVAKSTSPGYWPELSWHVSTISDPSSWLSDTVELNVVYFVYDETFWSSPVV